MFARATGDESFSIRASGFRQQSGIDTLLTSENSKNLLRFSRGKYWVDFRAEE